MKIDSRKPGFDSVSIFMLKKGDVQWKTIAVRKRKFPYYDESPLAVVNTPEVREYVAHGVVHDEEVGQPSEIIKVASRGRPPERFSLESTARRLFRFPKLPKRFGIPGTALKLCFSNRLRFCESP